VLAAVAVWVVVLPVVGYTYFNEQAKVSALQNRVDQVTIQARNFNTLIREKQRLERLRDSLVVELAAIREIDADRYVWAHIMEEVTKALPDFTWLVSLEFGRRTSVLTRASCATSPTRPGSQTFNRARHRRLWRARGQLRHSRSLERFSRRTPRSFGPLRYKSR
jgi:Tfp pilus assembly protein PilN